MVEYRTPACSLFCLIDSVPVTRKRKTRSMIRINGLGVCSILYGVENIARRQLGMGGDGERLVLRCGRVMLDTTAVTIGRDGHHRRATARTRLPWLTGMAQDRFDMYDLSNVDKLPA
jgi:hypothetical protein